MDTLTKRWIRNASDEAAVAQGAFFNLEAASYFVWWVERYCRLYEGDHAGQRLVLMSCVDQPEWEVPPVFNWNDPQFRELYTERCYWHLSKYESGAHMDWQYDCHMRIYGWQMYSAHFRRNVRRFQEATIFTAKKNKKSPSMAANAMYLSCGDGEQGAKTFIMAKTGRQAREIAGLHIYEMWRRCTELLAESKFNQNELRLYHFPTSSIICPLASDTHDARESNEGRNGNVLIDELHVVDRETVDIVDRAGISRAEPLHMEFSTAGKNNSGYGRERFDQALAIQESDEINVRMFAAVYAADQNLQVEELTEDNILQIAEKANPSLGHTIDPDELKGDYVTSKRTPHEFRNFLMYRLNIWRQEGVAFIPLETWRKCGLDFAFEDFLGAECDCALDMAVASDLVAFAWNFVHDGKVWIWVDHWLPRARAIELQEQVPLLDWEKEGWIRLLPGKLIDEELVFNDIMARARQVKIKTIAFDPNRARFLRLKLEAEGFPMELFRQNNREWHPCVERFEKLVVGDERTGKILLHHPKNPLLTFQVKHAQVDEDRFSYKRIVKPESGDHKKVDGLQAAVMTIRAMDVPAAPIIGSAYADPQAPWLQVL